MPKPRMLHIGYPKCMSTSLQRDYFDKHPEIYFLGWGREDTEHGWISDEMAGIGEVELRYSKSFMYDEKAVAQYINKHLELFERDDSKKLLCFSFESMSFTMHYDIDAAEKARRLKALFGPDCKVLMVVRNQLDLFRSYYFECVRGGYAGHFNQFIEYNYFHLFRSILSDLFYDRMLELYATLFGQDNVAVMPMELLATNQQAWLKEISSFLNISPLDFELQKHNASDDKTYIAAVKLLNEKFPNNMGSGYFGMTDPEKLVPYWKGAYGQLPVEATRTYNARMMIYRAARDVVKDFVPPLEADYPDEWRETLNTLFAPHNSMLASMTGWNLKDLGYPCN